VADPTRRRILELLAERERPVMELVSRVGISQPSVSEHLRILRGCGLVRARPEGRQRVYFLDAGPIRDLTEWLSIFERFWEDRLDRLGTLLDRRHRRPRRKSGER
jgi:DNA-binding transcriptional ArsR family regulator